MPKTQRENYPDMDEGIAKELRKYEGKSFKRLIDQIETEYQVSYWHMKPKWDEWALRLKLYNNQKRDKTAVGDPLLFTIHQTVLASLYDDRLMVTFGARERGDIPASENLTVAAEYDYTEMQKDIVDYEWDWDSTFFGRGLLDMRGFDRKRKVPVAFVVDPMTFLRDPRATSVHGNVTGMNSLRFHGKEFRMTKREMKQSGQYFNLDQLKSPDADKTSLFDTYRQLRKEAQGLGVNPGSLEVKGDNAEFRVLEWWTYRNGKCIMVHLANDRKTVIRYMEWDGPRYPLLDRPIYPMSHDWDGVSIPDIVEDKQRARAVLINLGLKGARSALLPMYAFDTNKIKNKNDLDFGFNKHIPVDGNTQGAVSIIDRKQIDQSAQFILDLLDTSSQKATATPDIQQGAVGGQQRTATELSIVNQKVDTRYSLSAKVFGWSEKAFWREWYQRYKDNFASGIDEKIVRIAGALAPKFRSFTRENLLPQTDPDVEIESRVISEQKRMTKLQGFQNYMNVAFNIEGTNKRFMLRRWGKLLGLDNDDVQNIVPDNVHEMKADAENLALSAGKMQEVDPIDDDVAHMERHNEAADTPEKYAHIEAHKRSMYVKMMQPEVQTVMPPSTTGAMQPEVAQKTSESATTTSQQANMMPR